MIKITDKDIIEAYRAAEGVKPAQMARTLGISRQLLSRYLRGINSPATEIVMRWFQAGSADWVREMALEIFLRRPEFEVPCVCQTEIGDNGPCPRHAAVLVMEE